MYPTLIFTECHFDAATAKTLTELIPVLKAYGYHVFFEELPENNGDLSSGRKSIEKSIELGRHLHQLIDQFNSHPEYNIRLRKDLLPTDPADEIGQQMLHLTIYYMYTGSDLLYRQVLKNYESSSIVQAAVDTNLAYVMNAILRYEKAKHDLVLIDQLQKENFDFRGIDLPLPFWSSLFYGAIGSGYVDDPKRDSHMSEAYLRAPQGTLGRIGMLHAKLLEDSLLTTLPPDEVDARYVFINLRSHDYYPYDIDKDQYKPDRLVTIDCRNNSTEEIIRQIEGIIKEKAAACAALQPKFEEFMQQGHSDLAARIIKLQNSLGQYRVLSFFTDPYLNDAISAAKKLMEYFNPHQQNTLPEFTAPELAALHAEHLNDLVFRFETQGIMPPVAACSDNASTNIASIVKRLTHIGNTASDMDTQKIYLK